MSARLEVSLHTRAQLRGDVLVDVQFEISRQTSRQLISITLIRHIHSRFRFKVPGLARYQGRTFLYSGLPCAVVVLANVLGRRRGDIKDRL